MAASTITRDVWTDDTGTPASPNGDGTILDNSVLQDHIYARIDAMFAGAGAYTTFALGGLLRVEGFGSSSFSAGGAGGNAISVRNTSAGVGNYARLAVGNDATSDALLIEAYSTTYTTSGGSIQDGAHIFASRAGGLSINAAHASGVLRFYANGNAEAMRVTALKVLIGDTADGNITQGLTINQGANVDSLLTFKQSGVAHGMTAGGTDAVETDTYARFSTAGGAAGGLRICAYSETVTTANSIFQTRAFAPSGSGDTTKATTSVAFFEFFGAEHSAGAFGGVSANENLVVFRNGASATHIFDAEGDSHQDGTGWTAYDGHDDVLLADLVDRTLDARLRADAADFLAQNRAALQAARIVTFNEGSAPFINMSRLAMLHNGAIRQLGRTVDALRGLVREQRCEIETLQRHLGPV